MRHEGGILGASRGSVSQSRRRLAGMGRGAHQSRHRTVSTESHGGSAHRVFDSRRIRAEERPCRIQPGLRSRATRRCRRSDQASSPRNRSFPNARGRPLEPCPGLRKTRPHPKLDPPSLSIPALRTERSLGGICTIAHRTPPRSSPVFSFRETDSLSTETLDAFQTDLCVRCIAHFGQEVQGSENYDCANQKWRITSQTEYFPEPTGAKSAA